MPKRTLWLLVPLLGTAALAPTAAVSQEGARPTIEVRLLGGYVRPSLSGLEEAFAQYRMAETAGTPLGSDPTLRRSVAGSVSGGSEFDGIGGALEVGGSMALGGATSRRVGLALQLGYERVGTQYEADFAGGMPGSREESLQLARAAVVPRYAFGMRGLTASVGASVGLMRIQYRSKAFTELTSQSGRTANPSARFSGDETTWTAGLSGEVKRTLASRLALLGRVGYEYAPEVEIAVTGSDIDAAYRNQLTRPYSPVLAFPETDGTMGTRPVPVDVSGIRLQLGLEYQIRE